MPTRIFLFNIIFLSWEAPQLKGSTSSRVHPVFSVQTPDRRITCFDRSVGLLDTYGQHQAYYPEKKLRITLLKRKVDNDHSSIFGNEGKSFIRFWELGNHIEFIIDNFKFR